MSDRLAREIINNTPLSAGDRIDSPSPDLAYVGNAYTEGRVSRAAVDYANQLYETGGRLPDPDAGGGGGGGGSGGGGGGGSGGGGGGGGGGSDPSPQPDPEPDRSQLRARLENLSSFGPEEVTVYWSVTNEVTSGTGQQKSGTVAIDLDGRTQERQSVTVSPGGSRSGSVRLADVTPGTREVCVRLQ